MWRLRDLLWSKHTINKYQAEQYSKRLKERFSLSLMPTSMRKFYITSNTIGKKPLLQCYLLEPAWQARLIARDYFISRVPPESFFFYSTGASVVLCLAVWPREEWEERPQPAKWSYAGQLKTLVNNDSIDYSTWMQTCGYTSLVISLFSSQCACILPYIH